MVPWMGDIAPFRIALDNASNYYQNVIQVYLEFLWLLKKKVYLEFLLSLLLPLLC